MEEKAHVTGKNYTGEREHVVGRSVKRVDAFEKVTGRAKYTDDLCDKNAYVAKVLHSTIAHGYVKSIDTPVSTYQKTIIPRQDIHGPRKRRIRMWQTVCCWWST